ncbi:hypothetical protein [Nonomuraea sp. SYSU D8015]|uniref:hypothetical protein n=1 Tax=Nonomuraea sp. SYSU D8015 TaxID=2593644 RepID=UPI001660663D|nr:hypothetical protein [Nonomuraea sp. SYSU D8015]
MKRVIVAVLAGAGMLAAGLLTAMPSGSAGNSAWRLVHQASSLAFSDDLVALGERDVWAFGSRQIGYWRFGATAYHWDGERWADTGLPTRPGGSFMTAGASSPTNVWAVTSGDETGMEVLRWDGRAWTPQPRPPVSSAQDLIVLGEDDVWLFGEQSWHRTASGWADAHVPMVVSSASARSATDIWAVGWDRAEGGTPLVGHYDGRAWRLVPLGEALPPSPTRRYSLASVAAGASGVVITANVLDDTTQTTKPILLHRTEDGWRTEAVTEVTGPWRETSAPIPDGRGGHWFLGSTDVNGYDSALAHRSAGGAWTVTPVSPIPGTAEFVTLASVPGTSRFLATGQIDSTPGVYLHDAEP